MDNQSVAFEGIGSLLRRRYRWLIVGVVIGLSLALAYQVITPRTYTATAVVNISSVSGEAATGGRAASALLDMSTETQVAGSDRTALAAADALGNGWTASELAAGTDVTANADSTILRIAFTDHDEQRARHGAQEMATAYLFVRTDLVRERNASKIDAIDAEIERVRETYGGRNNASARQVFNQTLSSLEQQRAELGTIYANSGEIITPADASPVYYAPAVKQILALGLLGGLALGVALAFIAHFVSGSAAGRREVSQIMGAPVWPPVAPVGDEHRWDLAISAARAATSGLSSVAVIVDNADDDAGAAASALAALGNVHLSDSTLPTMRQISDASRADSTIAIIPNTWNKHEILALTDTLRACSVNLAGVILTGTNQDIEPLRTLHGLGA